MPCGTLVILLGSSQCWRETVDKVVCSTRTRPCMKFNSSDSARLRCGLRNEYLNRVLAAADISIGRQHSVAKESDAMCAIW